MTEAVWEEFPQIFKIDECETLQSEVLKNRTLIIAANRAPVTLVKNEDGEIEFQRGGGGLVTALLGLARYVNARWIGCSITEEDRQWREGVIPLENDEGEILVSFVSPDEESYTDYYNVIANPLLWFLQHSMWDFVRTPTFDARTWKAWHEGYVKVNRLFAEAIVRQIEAADKPPLVMLQDYHLYLVPRFIRETLGERKPYTLTHFVHIPWPGSEDWGMVPPAMRQAILQGLCSNDLLGFQTREDALNFIRTCESHLPDTEVNFTKGVITFHGHDTHVRDFPISIDVEALRELAATDDVAEYRRHFIERYGDRKLIVRVDRTEPSKNIVRGFAALNEMLELYPEHCGEVQFLALLVPSRMEVGEYQNYLDEIMAAAGRVNALHGDSTWEPVRVLVGEDYPRAVAAMQLYDILLVNSIADGMNLVAKEGPTVNLKDGVVILSERTGARQQLAPGALVISPCDIYATAEAMHRALIMPAEERRKRAEFLRRAVEAEDISVWLCWQLKTLAELGL